MTMLLELHFLSESGDALQDEFGQLCKNTESGRLSPQRKGASEVWGGSSARPTGKSFRLVCACVRAVLVKSFPSETFPLTPVSFIFGGWRSYLVSSVVLGSVWIPPDFFVMFGEF